MESGGDTRFADLAAKLLSAANHCEPYAKSATDGLRAGFANLDDVIVLLQPVRLAAAEVDAQSALELTLRRLAEKNFLTGTQAIDEGGIWAAMVCGCEPRGFGFHIELTETEGVAAEDALLSERCARALVSARPKAHLPLANFVERGRQFTAEAIGRVTAGDVRVQWMGEVVLEVPNLPLRRDP